MTDHEAGNHDYVTFVPWFRRNLGQHISAAPASGRASVTFQLDVLQDGQCSKEQQIQVTGVLAGPQDAQSALDPAEILATDPPRNVFDAEPNYFASVTLASAELPWLLTPTRPREQKTRLDPWIALIVLEDGEFTRQPRRPDGPPAITVGSVDSLPLLTESWAWAHVEVADRLVPIDAADTDGVIPDGLLHAARSRLQDLLDHDPKVAVSRLVCPRRLKPATRYHAFVVPTFLTGVQAGLGLPVDADPLAKAWTTRTESPDDGSYVGVNSLLPVYFEWEYGTGEGADFESLVRRLTPQGVDRRVGFTDVDCADVGYDLPPVNVTGGDPLDSVLRFEGALLADDTGRTPWGSSHADADGFRAALADTVLNRPANERDHSPTGPPLLVPPIFGRWQAARDRVDPHRTHWLDTLNLDPRYRAAAGLGAQIVRDNQEHLMAAAWRQAGQVEAANRAARRTRAAVAAGSRLFERNVSALSVGALLRLTGPVHQRLVLPPDAPPAAASRTVDDYLAGSRIGTGARSAAFRRHLYGPIRARQNDGPDVDRADVIERLNSGDVTPAGDPPRPDGPTTPGDVTGDPPSWARSWWWPLLERVPAALVLAAVVLATAAAVLGGRIGSSASTTTLIGAVAAAILLLAVLFARLISPVRLADQLHEEKLTSDAVRQADAPAGFEAAEGFRAAAVSVLEVLNDRPEETQPNAADLDLARNTIERTLHPARVLTARLAGRITVDGKAVPTADDVQVAPQFPEPLYRYLATISPEHLLPGLSHIRPNSVGVVTTNRQFIEAVGIGANHALADELRWREYPAQLSGTFFTDFWDHSIRTPDRAGRERLIAHAQAQRDDWDTLSPEAQEDIIYTEFQQLIRDYDPIDGWHRDLGENFPVPWRRQLGLPENEPVSEGEQLVLVVRGDLLRRYPGTVIYLARADSAREPILDDSDVNTRLPLFSGTLEPDITFLGFAVTKEEAGQDWVFVLEEPPTTGRRFGYDLPPTDGAPQLPSWDQLAVTHLTSDRSQADRSEPVAAGDHVSATRLAHKPADVGEPTEPYEQPTEMMRLKRDDTQSLVSSTTGELTENIQPGGVIWGFHAANIAWITMQTPVRITIHGSQLLEESKPT